MSEELKDCPFCGRDVDMLEDCQTGLYSVACLHNGCSVRPETDGNSTESDAVMSWNTRHIPEGFALVPIEPTEAMLIAGGNNEPFLDDIYKSMIEAAGNK